MNTEGSRAQQRVPRTNMGQEATKGRAALCVEVEQDGCLQVTGKAPHQGCPLRGWGAQVAESSQALLTDP